MGISKFYFFTDFFEYCWTLLNIIELCWTSWPVELNLKRFLHFTFLQNLLNIVEPCWTLSIWILLKILTSWVEFEEMKGEEAFTFPQNLPPDISDALPTKIERTIVSALLNPIPNSSFRKPRKQTMTFFSCSWKLIETSASTLSSALLSQKGWSCSMGARWALQSNYNLLWIIWI